ncbi:5-oxoprolinase subunit PxpB [Microbulbifer sp. THAF38]|uniref:5-oxoprolinase subunit PxpB n=1 Tax=Microbulbifer sp. THAF38 TaxID=2587856 RepID=UPI001269341C|nr:5-oxoprolinase subunit PxpB [Microbulbifer sp. THAF38]QFT53451.1 Kinase A inhibitor [Microbulbifer sp. THAF38]
MTLPEKDFPKKLDFNVSMNGDSALDIRFSAKPSANLSRYIIGLRQYILKHGPNGLTDLIPSYQCLTIIFVPTLFDNESLSQEVHRLTRSFLENPEKIKRKPRTIRIPVCYESTFAPDMTVLSKYTDLSPEEIIQLHTASPYLVHMLGFSPGFLYLGGLDPRLHCPRKDKPRASIPAGAVGIGGSQTGIYPQATPGGWQIIGQTPLQLFQPYSESPFIAAPLDTVEFFPINKLEFAIISQHHD